MKPTLKHIAKEAGVSTATVSMVLAGKGKISVAVQKQVLEATNRIGYKKSFRTGSLKSSAVQYVAVLAYASFNYQWNFVQPFVASIEEYLIQRNYYPILFFMSPSSSSERVFNRVMSSGASAVIVIHYTDKALFQQFQTYGIPVVLLNNNNLQKEFHSVCVDDFQGAYEGTQYLIELGHKNILYLEFERPDQPAVVADRFIGFKKAIDEAGITFSECQRITVGLDDYDTLFKKLDATLHTCEDITALFVHDDYFAARVLSVLEKLGKHIPDDLSIIAPGDVLSFDEPFTPQITTMNINTGIMGEHAARLVISTLEQEPESIHVLKIKEQLIDRGSCRALT